MIQIIKAQKNNIWLFLIVSFFLLTRFYKISEIPPSVYWDEASIGYNAFSLAQTGQDEWGDSFPLHFRAFGEFKLPVYIYATALSVKIFGLNEFSVRIPSVLFSLGVMILTYFLAKRLSESNMVGLFSSFFVTISPWFFIFSRTGFEATAGLMFYLLGILLFLYGSYGKSIFLSAVVFILSVYSYNSFRIIVPLTVLVLIFWERENFRAMFKKQLGWIILSLGIISISIVPIYRLYVYDVGLFRLQAVGSVNVEQFFKNYTSHFSLDFLLFGDKNLRHQQKDYGQVYLPELILILLGIVYMMNRKSKYHILILILLFLGPIPAAITKESPHALRAISIIPFISMISAGGVLSIKKYFPQKYLVEAMIIIIFLAFFTSYLINFISIYPLQSKDHWQFSYKNFFTQYKDIFRSYDRVIISDQYAQPYIFALFYLKYDPDKFRQEVLRNTPDQWGFSTVKKFGQFEFGKVDELIKVRNGRILIFANEFEVYEK